MGELGPLPTLVKSTTVGSNIVVADGMAMVRLPPSGAAANFDQFQLQQQQQQGRIIPEFSFTTTGPGGGAGAGGGGGSQLGTNAAAAAGGELGDLLLGLPPLIMTTAATPQGSPPNGPAVASFALDRADEQQQQQQQAM